MSRALSEALTAATLSCSGREIFIECSDHDSKDTIYSGLEAIAAGTDSSEIERLKHDLAEVDAMLATHAYLIDKNPRERWPKGSILAKALDRHVQRVQASLPVKARPQYYYRVTECRAPHGDHAECICWHDEGAGPLSDRPSDMIKHWRSLEP